MTSIKAIFRHAVEKAGGRKATAELLGVGTPELSLWGNDDHERFIPINHLMDLDAATGDIFLRDWARKRGYDLTALEVSEPKDNIYKIIGELSKAGGNLDCAALEAWSDNILTNNEKRDVRDKIARVRDLLDAVERLVGTFSK